MIIASNGERVVAASILPIPTSANAATGKSSPAPNCCSDRANVAPNPAPRKSVGVNTPPTAQGVVIVLKDALDMDECGTPRTKQVMIESGERDHLARSA